MHMVCMQICNMLGRSKVKGTSDSWGWMRGKCNHAKQATQ